MRSTIGRVRAASVPLAALALVGPVVLSGCGGDSEDASSTSGTSGSASSEDGGASSTAAERAREDRARREAAARPDPAAGDLANFSCTRRKGVWAAQGDVTNSADEAMVYTVTVVTVEGAEVTGDDSEQMLLKAGKSTSFDLPAVSRGDADACMPRLVREPR